ncbi:MAG: glycosyltransferase family 4 protein [Methanomassiliicoccales archaeon]|jgi:glycosyltransferase involved in cell wall biosynthesis|nr:glycosyltransferase family 4 protein [Methanomassiliicoccales archaeon]
MVISVPFPPEEGIGYHVYNLSKKLIERGHEVAVITRGKLKIEKMRLDGIDVLKAPFIPLYPFHISIHGYFLNKLFKKIEKNFDLVHIHTPLSPIVRTTLPIVSTIHGSMVENARAVEVVDLKSFGTKILTRIVSYPLIMKLINISDVVTTVSESVSEELKNYYADNNVIVVGNGIDLTLFSPPKQKKNENYIFYAGRISYGKGLFDLFEAAKRVCQRYNIKFMLAGKGELEGRLREKAKKDGLHDKFLLLGHINQKELVHLYQNATVFVMPSHYEGLPTVLLEAMACGLPVVATDVCGNRDVVNNGKNGLLVPPKSAQKMAEAISMLLEDKDLRIKLGRNARKTVEEKYTWDVVTDNVLNAYHLARDAR